MSLPNPAPERHYSAAGIVALVVVGLLFLIPSGLCTAVIGGGAILAAIQDPRNGVDVLDTLPMILVVAGPFLVGGGAMLITGIRRARANARNRQSPQ